MHMPISKGKLKAILAQNKEAVLVLDRYHDTVPFKFIYSNHNYTK